MDAEKERMKKLPFPNQVSEGFFKFINLAGKKVADVGSGPNPQLGQYFSSRNAMYFPYDVNPKILEQIKNELETGGGYFFGGNVDARNMSTYFLKDTFDFTHTRFVLMNINPDTRKKTVEEILKVTKDTAFFLEYDWSALERTSNENSKGFISEFKTLVFSIFERLNTDPFMGAEMDSLFSGLGVNYEKKVFFREEADYTQEFLGVLNSLKQILNLPFFENVKDENLSKINVLETKLKENNFSFIPPDIVCVTVKK